MRNLRRLLKHPKAHKKTENIKVVFYVESLEQIKSSSVVYNLKTFVSKITQGKLVPKFCNI